MDNLAHRYNLDQEPKMIDWEAIGAGAATGFITAILTLLGWNRRISKLEDEKADSIAVLAVDKKVDYLNEEYRYIRNRLDEIYSRLSQK